MNEEIINSIDSLLNFEKISYRIKDIKERNKFYIAVSFYIDAELNHVIAKSDNIEVQIEKLINVYENQLGYDPYYISLKKPKINHKYSYFPFTDTGMENKIFYKEAIVQKDQYMLFINYYKEKISKLTEYLYDLRMDYMYSGNNSKKYISNTEIQNLFYLNLQNLLVENLSLNNEEKFIRIMKDNDNKVIYIDWMSIEDSIVHTRFNDYFSDNLLAATRERENGKLIKDTIYGENQHSQKYFNYIYKNNFSMMNYDHYTEVIYTDFGDISNLYFYTLNNKLLGSIIYTYDNNKRLVNEVWSNQDKVLRNFSCYYELGQGKYRITERDSIGNIIYQDIINSLNEEKFINKE